MFPTGPTDYLAHRGHVSYLDARLPARMIRRYAAPHEFSGAILDKGADFIVHDRVGARRSEQRRDATLNLPKEGNHASVRSSRCMAAAFRSHSDVSIDNCFRPARVSE